MKLLFETVLENITDTQKRGLKIDDNGTEYLVFGSSALCLGKSWVQYWPAGLKSRTIFHGFPQSLLANSGIVF
jgi:hypothetical protein